MIVTLDTNVLLSATLWDGSVAQKLLFDLIKQNVNIFSSLEILNEYKKVLRRDFDFSEENIAEIMEKVLAFVTIVAPKEKVNVVLEDPDDNVIIECALESNSKYLITYDPHLLRIGKYKEIEIIRPEIARAIF
jgi:uncharacterized protein